MTRLFPVTALLVALVLLTPLAAAAVSPGDQSIAAIVNDDVISMRDLQNRIDLVVATGNMERSPDVRQKIAPEVLRVLIDERLKRQEARRLNVTVTPRDVDRALVDVAEQLRVPPNQLPEYLQSHGASMATLLAQLESEIAWIKTVSRLVGERTTFTEDEIDEELSRLRGSGGSTEYRLAEIYLPFEDATNERRAQELAERIAQESRGGASFAALARTFSQSSAADQGGDLGWVRAGQLDPRLDAAVQRLRPGEVADPLRTDTGFYVLQLLERRTSSALPAGATTLTMSQVALALPADAPPPQLAEVTRRVAGIRGSGAQGCSAFEARGREFGATRVSGIGRVELERLPPQIRQAVAGLVAGQISEPIRTPDGVLLLMVCERGEQSADASLKESVQRRLFEQRFAAIARQTLRDLRRTALLDVRM
jgi:peptidyl-prolyl cis-trans isomerase SurA